MTILCQVCGTANLEGTIYCEGCGVELSAAAGATPTATPETFAQATLPEETLPEESLSQGVSTATEDAAVSAAVDATPQVGTPLSSTEPGVETAPPTQSEVEGAAPVAAFPIETTSAVDAPEGSAPEESIPVSGAATSVPGAPVAEPAPDAPAGEAKLGIKKFGAPTGEFIPLQGERLVVGRFDASSGPVDIDLSGLGGQEHISRRHAELYREEGRWAVRDLGSTNGVYIKRKGETSFSPRLQEPSPLADGDELAFGNLMLIFHQS